MEIIALASLGFLIGMQHALEADHLAAVAAMQTRASGRREMVLRGSFWGIGHTATLTFICGALLIWGGTISERTESLLELAVGVMLILLGGNVLRRLWRQRPHVHVHEHNDGVRHLHVHSHAGETPPHSQSAHRHGHDDLGLMRALAVGMVHGAAGSAALLVLAAAASNMVQGLGYVLAFGIGSIAGMAALSFIASYPLGFLQRTAVWINRLTFACIGSGAVIAGSYLITGSWSAL